MPTSVTTTLGTDVVNLHYSLPAAMEPESSEIVSLNLNNTKPIIPISIHSLMTPANVVHANTVQIPTEISETSQNQLMTTAGSNFLFRPEVHQLTGSVTAQLTSAHAMPPMTSYIPNELTTIVDQHR